MPVAPLPPPPCLFNFSVPLPAAAVPRSRHGRHAAAGLVRLLNLLRRFRACCSILATGPVPGSGMGLTPARGDILRGGWFSSGQKMFSVHLGAPAADVNVLWYYFVGLFFFQSTRLFCRYAPGNPDFLPRVIPPLACSAGSGRQPR
jgi:hypothetical protein